MDHLSQMHLLKNQTDFNKLNARELENEQKNKKQFQIIKKQNMEQKSGKTIPHSFVEHELQAQFIQKPN